MKSAVELGTAMEVIEILCTDVVGARMFLGDGAFDELMSSPRAMADMLGRADNIVLRRGVLIVGHYCGGGMLMMHAFAAPSARGATVRRIVREYFRLAFRSEKDAMMIVGKIHPDNRPARHMAVACGMKPRRSDDDHCWYEVRRRG